MAQKISPPPYHEKDISAYVWQDWFNQFRKYVISPSIHNNLSNIQGGSATERYHLTNAQVGDLTTLTSIIPDIPKINYGFTYQLEAPLTGTTVNFLDNKEYLILRPIGSLATLTIALPPNPIDGQTIWIESTQTVTSVTLTSSKTILGTITTLSPLISVKYIYIAPDNTWYKL